MGFTMTQTGETLNARRRNCKSFVDNPPKYTNHKGFSGI